MITTPWDSKFEVGHERIDFEHRIFLGLIRAMSEESDGANRPARLLRLLREVRKYADFHFLSEENIMEDANYPGLAQQRQQHIALLSRLDEKIHESGFEPQDFEGITGFLFEWFALHTTNEDRKLGQFLANRPADPV